MPNDNVLTPERRFYFANRMIHIDDLEDRIALVRAIEREVLAAHPGQPEPRASAGVIAAAIAVIEADRAQTLTNEHVDALDIAIKIQRGMFKLPEPRVEVTDDQIAAMFERVTGYSIENGRAALNDADILGFARELLEAARPGASS